MGNVIGVDALSGLSAAFPAQIAAVAVGLLPGLGGMSVVSRALGARDTRQASRVIGSSLLILAPIYLAMTIAGLLNLDALTGLMGASANTAPYAREYLVIILPGGILTMLAIMANNLLMAEGRPGSATIILAGGAIANVILDALFIVVFGWGITGAAAAHRARAGIGGPIRCVVLSLGKQRTHRLLRCNASPTRTDAGNRCVGFAHLHYRSRPLDSRHRDQQHPEPIPGRRRLHRPVRRDQLGPGIRAGPVHWHCAGVSRPRRLQLRREELPAHPGRAIWQSCLGATVAGALVIAVLLPVSGYLIALFAETDALPAEAAGALRVALLALPVVGVEFVGSVAFQALGKAWPSVVLTVTQRVVLLLIWVIALSEVLGVWGVWWSFPRNGRQRHVPGVWSAGLGVASRRPVGRG